MLNAVPILVSLRRLRGPHSVVSEMQFNFLRFRIIMKTAVNKLNESEMEKLITDFIWRYKISFILPSHDSHLREAEVTVPLE